MQKNDLSAHERYNRLLKKDEFIRNNLFLSQLWEQKKQEEQRREKERLEALRKKDKHDHSANASTEVKTRLHVNLNFFLCY